MISGEQTQDLLQLRRAHPAEQAAQSALGRPAAGRRRLRDRVRQAISRALRRLLRLRPARPDETTGKQTMAASEAAVQRYGWRCTAAGSSILGLTLIVVLLFRENLRDASPPFVSFCVIMSAVALGGVFLSVGISERLNRYGRTMDRANTVLLDRVATEQRVQGALLRTTAELVGHLAKRVDQIERTVEKAPGFGEAFMAGMTVARGVTDDERG